MTFDQFITKYNNKFVDFDGAYGNQCFDLYRQYCKEVLQVPQSPPTGSKGAVTIKDTYLTEYFTKIENTPTGVPKKGDIVIWDTRYGQYGHVAIFVSGDENTFKAFSQNDPINSACVVRIYKNYYGVNCWLRPKKEPMATDLEVCLAQHKQLVDEAKIKDAEIKALKEDIKLLENEINQLSEELNNCSKIQIEKEIEVSGIIWEINGLQVDSAGKVIANYRIK